jgi:uncharacterized repeat protein (TIGR02543 family)
MRQFTPVNLSDYYFTRDGWIQTGWEDTVGIPVAETDFIINNTQGPNVVYYAVWREHITLKISDGNGNEIVKNLISGDRFELPDTLFSRDYYTLTGWRRDDGTSVGVNASIVVNRNETITAIWTALEFTITFRTNGGGVIPDIQGRYGDTLALRHPSRDGMDFMGWYADEELTVKYEETTFKENITLYAKWELSGNKPPDNPNPPGPGDGESPGGGMIVVIIAGAAVVAAGGTVAFVLVKRRKSLRGGEDAYGDGYGGYDEYGQQQATSKGNGTQQANAQTKKTTSTSKSDKKSNHENIIEISDYKVEDVNDSDKGWK